MIAVIILAKNEELHIVRAIQSVLSFAGCVFVVDSGSTDRTVELAKSLGAFVAYREWRNYSTQFNWALENLPISADWILRLDADEVVSKALQEEIGSTVNFLDETVVGINVGRRMCFLGRPIRYGGLFPIRVLRLVRFGLGRCEDRWMDEHLMVSGDVVEFQGEIIDDNLNSLTWWTDKHNAYASREVVDLLNGKFNFMPSDSVAKVYGHGEAGTKRWLKEVIYNRLPIGFRAFCYFFYRFIVRLGFLDGHEGLVFHVLQGFWYRFLVDAKLKEVLKYMENTGSDPVAAIREVLGIKVTLDATSASASLIAPTYVE